VSVGPDNFPVLMSELAQIERESFSVSTSVNKTTLTARSGLILSFSIT
jgi:hypothetical protein